MQRLARTCAIAVIAACAAAPAEDARERLIKYLNAIGRDRIAERDRAISQIQTRAAAETRKAQVREKILRLIGGLPDTRDPLSVKQFGALPNEGFRIERIIYESLPGFYVTANVYVPTAGGGPFPAVVLTPGHAPSGKIGEYGFGANLARNGIMALAYDPIGEGERLQYFDPELGASKVGGPTGEHSHASFQTLLLGEHVSRYFIWDAMRGIDYLTSRRDVDAGRIGAFGCSGGGTVTAYLAALDDRVKAAASACYITSFRELLTAPAGPQEAEQSIPHFLEQGLDFADWVELAAPRPYAIVSTTNDMFPFEGARQTYDEAKRIYGLYGAAERLQWITGPGGHGALGPVSPAILAFFVRWLKESDARPGFTRLRPDRPDDLLCTPAGQLATSFKGETATSLNKKRAGTLLPPKRALSNSADLDRLQTRLQEDIRTTAVVTAQPGSKPPVVTVLETAARDSYRLETISVRSEEGIDLPGWMAIPKRGGAKPAVLMLESRDAERLAAPGGDLDRLAHSGHIVLALQARPSPAGTESVKSPLLGVYNLLALRAMLAGKTLVGMRTDDAIRAVDWLCSRADVDASAIVAYANGPLGVVLLHAAALDRRIGRVWLENTLATYRMVVDQPIHRNVPEIALPGVLRKYDLGDLLLAVGPRPVAVINPVDAVGTLVREEAFRKELAYVFESGRNLGSPERVRILRRGFGEPLPID